MHAHYPRLMLQFASRTLAIMMHCALLSGCAQPFWNAQNTASHASGVHATANTHAGVDTKPLRLGDFAKNDIDKVADIHIALVRTHLKTLMHKLYARNPSQWRANNKPSAEFMVQRVFRGSRVPDFVELAGRRGVDAIRLAFDNNYDGDRVLALLAGLTDMVQQAYGGQREFYLLDSLDPQKLYNSARNIETAAWLLRTRTDNAGTPLVVSHTTANEPPNLSFERVFGKIISLQDTLAQIVAGRSNRAVRTVVQSMVGTVVFLPI